MKYKIIILFCLAIITWNSLYINNKKINNITLNDYEIKEKIKTYQYNQANNPDYIGFISIPKIKLENKLYKKESNLNNVNKNVMVLNDSSYPDEKNGNFILAAHSGTGKFAYFNNLKYLDIGDIIYTTYYNKVYEYKLKNIYEIKKNGTARIKRNKNISSITLITCKPNTNKQIVLIGELINM